jgi:cell division initiation protein
MRITPLDIRKQEFRKTVRGLDPEEVHAFLTTVADEYEAVLTDNKALRERLVELDDKVQEYRAMEKTLRDTLVTAERVRGEAQDNARREAELLIRQAQLEAEKASSGVRERARRLRSEIMGLQNLKETYVERLRGLLESNVKYLDSLAEGFGDLEEVSGSLSVEDVRARAEAGAGAAAETSGPAPSAPPTSASPAPTSPSDSEPVVPGRLSREQITRDIPAPEVPASTAEEPEAKGRSAPPAPGDRDGATDDVGAPTGTDSSARQHAEDASSSRTTAAGRVEVETPDAEGERTEGPGSNPPPQSPPSSGGGDDEPWSEVEDPLFGRPKAEAEPAVPAEPSRTLEEESARRSQEESDTSGGEDPSEVSAESDPLAALKEDPGPARGAPGSEGRSRETPPAPGTPGTRPQSGFPPVSDRQAPPGGGSREVEIEEALGALKDGMPAAPAPSGAAREPEPPASRNPSNPGDRRLEAREAGLPATGRTSGPSEEAPEWEELDPPGSVPPGRGAGGPQDRARTRGAQQPPASGGSGPGGSGPDPSLWETPPAGLRKKGGAEPRGEASKDEPSEGAREGRGSRGSLWSVDKLKEGMGPR